jgi:hypothetical protein
MQPTFKLIFTPTNTFAPTPVGGVISYHSRMMKKHFCERDFIVRPRPASAP